MQEIILDLRISADEYLRLYRGQTRTVLARARDGRRVRFPAAILQPYVTRDGIAGSFRIRFDAAGKLQSIQPLG